MSPKPNIVVHIGFPRTGTTTLQRHLFFRHPEILYLGKPYGDLTMRDSIDALIMEESTVYRPEALRNLIESRMERGLEGGRKVFLLSEERLVSAAKVRDKGVVAQRLFEVFGACKILVTIRNQIEAVKSAYLSGGRYLAHVPHALEGRLISFEDWLYISERMYHGDYVRNVTYFDTIRYYADLFGKDRLCILLFEDFVEEKRKFLGTLSQFLGIDEGRAWELARNGHENESNIAPAQAGALARLTSGIWGRTDLKAGLSADRRERLSNLYREGNRKLEQEFHLSLGKRGYPV